MPHQQRPFKAWQDFSVEHRCSLSLNSPTVSAIFDWFYEHSPPGAHHAGPLFTSACFYDAAFWPIHIPIILGTVHINMLDCMETMPPRVKAQLVSSGATLERIGKHWVNCMDYGLGHLELAALRPRAEGLFKGAHAELIGAIAQLLLPRPNTKAVLSFVLAIEIYLKCVLVQERDATEKELRDLSHNLLNLIGAVEQFFKPDDISIVRGRLHSYPPHGDRYKAPQWSSSEAWEYLELAQVVGTIVTRRYSARWMDVT